MNKQNITALLFIVVFALCDQTLAQMKDTGTYIVYVGSQAVAEENYTSEKLADGTVKTVSKVATTTYTTTTRNDKPVEFSIQANGVKVSTTTFANGEAKTLIDEKPVKVIKNDATVITENNVWSNFINLLAQYDRKKGGAQTFVAFLPSQSLTFPVSLEKTDAKDFKLKNQTVSLTRYKLIHTESGLEMAILADDSNVSFFVEIPLQQAQIVKKGFEELREMTAPPKNKLINFTGEFTSEEVSFPNGENMLARTLTQMAEIIM
ncbi:MAG: hypothetical protein M3388_10760 [Acidobacteriota bacterium]|nr:hypothetical protein [Acidobacteriota bacterium]